MARWFWLVVLIVFPLLVCAPVLGDTPSLKDNSPWPQFTLAVPDDTAKCGYLGVGKTPNFSVDQIQSEYIIVQIFSMYCPICQREAPRVNQLYHAIDKRSDLNQRLKIIGIGAGNSAYEVDFYRQTYNVPFPLFPDGQFDIHKMIGEVGTPHFFLLKKEHQDKTTVLYQKSGGFKDPEVFLNEIIKYGEIK